MLQRKLNAFLKVVSARELVLSGEWEGKFSRQMDGRGIFKFGVECAHKKTFIVIKNKIKRFKE